MKESTLAHKVHVRVLISIPEICGSFESQDSEKLEQFERFMEEDIAPQYFRIVRKFLDTFQKADIPEKFYNKQEIIVSSFHTPEKVRALYNWITREIYFDPNSLILSDADFVFGHELGHKIIHVKSNGSQTIKYASNILSNSNTYEMEELLANALAAVMTGKVDEYSAELPSLKQEGLKRAMLKLAWSV